MSLRGVYRLLVKRVRFSLSLFIPCITASSDPVVPIIPLVTDMLIAILNTCTKEELEEEEEDEVLSPDVTSPSEEGASFLFFISLIFP